MIKIICAKCMSDDIEHNDDNKDDDMFRCKKCKNEFEFAEAMWEAIWINRKDEVKMKMWEILKKDNIGKVYKRTDCRCEYKYKVELRTDEAIELVSYSPYDDRMGFVHGNSMTFEWTYEEL